MQEYSDNDNGVNSANVDDAIVEHNFEDIADLPEHDSDLEYEIYDVEQNVLNNRATKRHFDEPTTPNIVKTRKFREKKTYNIIGCLGQP